MHAHLCTHKIEINRQTIRQLDRQTNSKTDRQTDRQTDKNKRSNKDYTPILLNIETIKDIWKWN